ncbi:T9SS type A sorting domain-containing protein [bacterium]|nr:T9SS type A sorting domain-containing protein [bacterium]
MEYDELVSQVQFEYRLQGASDWEWLGVDGGADSTFGNAGNTWSITLPGTIDAGAYDVRAISQYPAGPGEASVGVTPVATVVIKRDAANNRLVALNPENRISLAVSGAAFSQSYAGVEQTMTGSLIIASSQTLTEVNARLLMDGVGTDIDRYLNVSSSSGVWTASMDLSELFGGGNGMIVINATDISGNILSASQPFAVVAAGTNPGAITVGRVTLAAGPFGTALENASALAVMPASMPTVPAAQASLITPVGEPWEFLLSEPEAFDVTNTCTITMTYTDAEVSGLDETKLGVAYWDESKGIWSAAGITNVARDTVNNDLVFTTNHFSRYCLAVINTAPAVTFVSPASGGMSGQAPIIEANIVDGFSAIRQAKVVLDGVDQTAAFAAVAYRDGIDNDGNGLIDEDLVGVGGNSEAALNNASAVSAKYKVRPGLQLSDGAHTLAITATNEQGVSATTSISFTVGGAVGITSAYIAPNPYNPTSGYDAQIKVNMTADANITLKVYDFGGKLVYTSKTNSLSNGNDVFWNGRTNGNKLLANGVYLIRIEADTSQGTDSKVIKAALLR